MKKPRFGGAKFLAGCRNASNGNPPTSYHIGCTAFGKLAPVDKMNAANSPMRPPVPEPVALPASSHSQAASAERRAEASPLLLDATVSGDSPDACR